MNWSRIAILVALGVLFLGGTTQAEDYLLADGAAWPGKIWIYRSGNLEPYFARSLRQPQEVVPRIQSLTLLGSDRVAFCSGLDRSVFQISRPDERVLHHGGYLARQVRTDAAGTVYWSGLETPLNGNPLPDGFIYSLNPATNEATTLLTFSQGDVGRDWWGAFDVHQGRLFVSTLRGPSRLYDVSVSPVKLVATLPFSTTAFRFGPDGSLYACNGKGQLLRIRNLDRPEEYETLLDLPLSFVDFAVLNTTP